MAYSFAHTIAQALNSAKLSKAARTIIENLIEDSDDETTRKGFMDALSDGEYLAAEGIDDQDAVEEAFGFIESLGRDVDDDAVLSCIYSKADNFEDGGVYTDEASAKYWIEHLASEEGSAEVKAWLDEEGYKSDASGVDEAIRLAADEIESAAEELGTDNAFKAVSKALGVDAL